MKIFYADVTASQGFIPLGIGSIAAYVGKHCNMHDAELFVDPYALHARLHRESPDILMISNYCWNANLSRYFISKTKELNSNTVVIAGGPDFSLDTRKRERFMRENPGIDFYVYFNGEIPAKKIVQELIRRDMNVGLVKQDQDMLDSTAYIHDGQYVQIPLRSSLDSLDEIPSPFDMGVFDQFFAAKRQPLLQTVRGCPYFCAYCNMGTRSYSRPLRTSLERFKSDFRLVVDKMRAHRYTRKNIHIVDDNFGLYPEDYDKAIFIKEMHDSGGTPDRIIVYSAKNINQNVLKTFDVIKDMVYYSLTNQSLNKETLHAIRRVNKGVKRFKTTCKMLKDRGFRLQTELISSLPLETRSSFMKGLSIVDDLGFSECMIYQLRIDSGSPMERDDYMEKYDIEVKYRQRPNSSITFPDRVIHEFERIVVKTSTMSMDDYYYIRLVSFLLRLQVAFQNNFFFSILKHRYGITGIKLAELIADKLMDGDNRVENEAFRLLKLFVSDAQGELLNAPEIPEGWTGEQKNLVKKYRALLLTTAYGDLCDLYHDLLLRCDVFPEADRPLLEGLFEYMKVVDVRTYFPSLFASPGKLMELCVEAPEKRALEALRTSCRPAHEIVLPRAVYSCPESLGEKLRDLLEFDSTDIDERIRSYDAFSYLDFKMISQPVQ